MEDSERKLVIEGLQSLDKRINEAYGVQAQAHHLLEMRIQKLEVEVAPIKREFDERLPERISIAEREIEAACEDIENVDKKVNRFWGIAITTMLTAIGALIAALWEVLSNGIRDKG